MNFHGLLTVNDSGRLSTALTKLDENDLMPGEVTISVDYSTINYKDAMAISGRAVVIQSFPLVPGIDLAGTVEESSYPGIARGDRVVVNGWELGQTHHGGYAQFARVPGEWVVRLPDRLSTMEAMAIGTAGYTAMLCILALEHGGIEPSSGTVLVTGASGGVGSIAVALLSRLGYRVTASTGRIEESTYLRSLGASKIIDRAELSSPATDPLGTQRWSGAIDSVGSHTLVNVLSQTHDRGVVAACGLAQGTDLPGTVLPFILRNVTLAGIDSVHAPRELRELAWSRLADDLDREKLTQTMQTVGLGDVPGMVETLLAGRIRGRTVVDVNAIPRSTTGTGVVTS
ncbi:MDR family oxidoreductase [Gordonia sp. Z-3]|uniref:acrylyl-CoA reductase (NADPH) n=1 Tax=Gordonia sp. Z-3 TaxID=3115408 RepID=UPI002E2B5764|nr:MDR family oxidoreductase [Gordonia sp. Z-3]MED5802748.1 MDR family oxidoreductase [Gordonia sp. Z-3]